VTAADQVHRQAARLELAALVELERLIAEAGPWVRVRTACEVEVAGRRFPVPVVTMGSEDPQAPAVGLFGGVHGLERIGAEVVLAYLRTLVSRLPWDRVQQRQLESLRLVFMPLVNPGGLWLGTRANPQGVDLMRNAPQDAVGRVPFLVGGQRLSAALPWYRGPAGAPMQAESQALCEVVEQELLGRPFSLAVDCHSGFGLHDRIWFPYACRREPIGWLPELHALKALLDASQVHHPYVFEPQSRLYLAHGDLWDHLSLGAQARDARAVFLSLTLEMGSWLWVRKNPRQLFSRDGLFNPLIAHRQQRVLRRHIGWLDFLTRAASGHALWLPQGAERERCRRAALAHWYPDHEAIDDGSERDGVTLA
jgi:hypothetical protein